MAQEQTVLPFPVGRHATSSSAPRHAALQEHCASLSSEHWSGVQSGFSTHLSYRLASCVQRCETMSHPTLSPAVMHS